MTADNGTPAHRDGQTDDIHMMDDNELGKENVDPIGADKSKSISDSVFIQVRTSASNKKRRRSKKEPAIDEVTQISK